MSAVFVRPLPFTAASTSPTPAGGSVLHLANDNYGTGWRFGFSGAYLIVDLGPDPVAYNYVALFGANFTAADTVQIRTGTDTNAVNGYSGAALPAYLGTKDASTTTKAIVKLASTRTERYVRIDIVASGHTDSYLQFSRLVIGQAILADAIELGAEQTFETQSVIETGAGWRNTDDYASLDAWKFSTSWIDETAWRSTWSPMLRYASRGRGIMFIADDSRPTTWQNDTIFGFLVSTATGKWDAYNCLRFEAKLIAYGQ